MDFKAILVEKGWSLKDEFLEESIKKSKCVSVESIIADALNQDLKEIGKASSETFIPSDTNEISGPLVLQIQKIKNVLISSKYEDSISKSGKFLPKIFFTDGSRSISGIAFKQIPNIKENTPPGTKILLSGKIPVVQGLLLLTKSNTQVLGGRVGQIIENWNLRKSLAGFERTQKKDGDCPPPFIPFNYKRPNVKLSSNDDFKSFEPKTNVKPAKGNDTFSLQRKATIEAALEEKKKKSEKTLTDEQLAELMQMGFSLEDSMEAGKKSQGNFYGAINILTHSS